MPTDRAELVANILDFVEGRTPPTEFATRFYDEPAFAELLEDEGGGPPPYIDAGTYVYVATRNLDEPEGALAAQGALSSWLTRHGVEHTQRSDLSSTYETALRAMPAWLDVRGEDLAAMLEEARERTGQDLEGWLKREFKRRFVSIGKPPRWVQSPEWPVIGARPMVFLGQLPIGDLLHDAGFVYVFIDPATSEVKTVLQLE